MKKANQSKLAVLLGAMFAAAIAQGQSMPAAAAADTAAAPHEAAKVEDSSPQAMPPMHDMPAHEMPANDMPAHDMPAHDMPMPDVSTPPTPTPAPMPTQSHAQPPMPVPASRPEAAPASMPMPMQMPMQMPPMQGGKAPADARDPAAYNEGVRMSHLPGMDMGAHSAFGQLLVNKLELARGDNARGGHPRGGDARGQNLDAEAWYGGDIDKLWFKAKGERRDGSLEQLRNELLWHHAISPFWNTQVGGRHDSGGGPARNWLALGVEGLAPYWIDSELSAYWRPGGGVAVRAGLRYEVLLTQRWILEPEFEANAYSQADRARGLGAGLSDIELGLRLRYEVRRQLAPYIGVNWKRSFGDTARMALAEGGRRQQAELLAGVRFWF